MFVPCPRIDIQDQARNPIALMVCRSCGEHDEKVGIGLFIFRPPGHGSEEHQAIQAELPGQPLMCLSKRGAERRRQQKVAHRLDPAMMSLRVRQHTATRDTHDRRGTRTQPVM